VYPPASNLSLMLPLHPWGEMLSLISKFLVLSLPLFFTWVGRFTVERAPSHTSHHRACLQLTDINRFHLWSPALADAADAKSDVCTSLSISLSFPLLCVSLYLSFSHLSLYLSPSRPRGSMRATFIGSELWPLSKSIPPLTMPARTVWYRHSTYE
jgi:hypothetical protein